MGKRRKRKNYPAVMATIPIVRGGWKPPHQRDSAATNGGVNPLPRGAFGQPAPPHTPHKIFPFATDYIFSDKTGKSGQGRSWKFTDHRKGIRYEGLVGGTDLIMDILSEGCRNGVDGFRLEFSDREFPGFEHRAKRVREEEKTWAGPAGHSALSRHEEAVAQGNADPDFSGFLGHMPASCIPDSVKGVGIPVRSTTVPRSGWARGKSWREQMRIGEWTRRQETRSGGPHVVQPVRPIPGGPGPVIHHVTESGNTYRFNHQGKEFDGWLCPALFKYFQKAPDELFIKASTLTPAQQAAVALSA